MSTQLSSASVNPLDKYRKTQSDGAAGAIFLEDWNGLLDEVGAAITELRLKAVGFDVVAATAIEVLLKRINDVLDPAYDAIVTKAARIEQLLALFNGAGVSADGIIDTARRVLVTPAQRALIDTAAQALDLDRAVKRAAAIGVRDLYLTGF